MVLLPHCPMRTAYPRKTMYRALDVAEYVIQKANAIKINGKMFGSINLGAKKPYITI